jgi:hypothetical protein
MDGKFTCLCFVAKKRKVLKFLEIIRFYKLAKELTSNKENWKKRIRIHSSNG